MHRAAQEWHPYEERFKETVSLGKKRTQTCPIIVSAMSNTPLTFGPNCLKIRGVSTRDTTLLKEKEQGVAIPWDFHKIQRMVTIIADIMFVNGIFFLVTFLGNIEFRPA